MKNYRTKLVSLLIVGVLSIGLFPSLIAGAQTNSGETGVGVTFIEGDPITPKPPEPTTGGGGILPQTGEATNQLMWMGLLAVGVSLTLYVTTRKKLESGRE